MGTAFTEAEALTNWCPEARVASIITPSETVGLDSSVVGAITQPIAVGVNRHPERRDPFEGAHCIGAKCMHWLWLTGGGRGKKGYCGLSGRPTP